MSTQSGIRMWALVVVCWLGANVAALWGLDRFELQQLALEHDVPVTALRQFSRHTTHLSTNDRSASVGLDYRKRPPPSWSALHSVPLFVFLHGAGERGHDNVQQLRGVPARLCSSEFQRQIPCAILAPQCPAGRSWQSSVDREHGFKEALLQMIEETLQDDRIDPHRVYLCGYSMGGRGSWSLAAQIPARFAAVIPIAGGADPSLATALRDIPIWAVHSADDEVVSVEETRQIVAALRAQQSGIRYTELKDAGHAAWQPALQLDSEILRWMLAQRRASKTVAPDASALPDQ